MNNYTSGYLLLQQSFHMDILLCKEVEEVLEVKKVVCHLTVVHDVRTAIVICFISVEIVT